MKTLSFLSTQLDLPYYHIINRAYLYKTVWFGQMINLIVLPIAPITQVVPVSEGTAVLGSL
jgi:hypothetical protein